MLDPCLPEAGGFTFADDQGRAVIHPDLFRPVIWSRRAVAASVHAGRATAGKRSPGCGNSQGQDRGPVALQGGGIGVRRGAGLLFFVAVECPVCSRFELVRDHRRHPGQAGTGQGKQEQKMVNSSGRAIIRKVLALSVIRENGAENTTTGERTMSNLMCSGCGRGIVDANLHPWRRGRVPPLQDCQNRIKNLDSAAGSPCPSLESQRRMAGVESFADFIRIGIPKCGSCRDENSSGCSNTGAGAVRRWTLPDAERITRWPFPRGSAIPG